MVSRKRIIPLVIALLLSSGLMMCGSGGGGSNDPSTLQVSSLTLSSGTDDISLSPAFDQDTAAYTATVTNDITNVDVEAVTEPASATVTVTGNMGLHIGANIVRVTITSGTDTLAYTIVITRGKSDLSTLLESLKLSAGGSPVVLAPVFDPDVFVYSAEVFDETSVVVTATTVPAGVEVTVTGDTDLEAGDNLITVVIESGDDPLTYQIMLTRKITPMGITALTLSAGGSPVDISPSFVQTTTLYTASVDNTVTSASIAATVTPAGATVTGTGSMSLNEGDNTAIITASFNGQTAVYTVIVYRAHDYSDEDTGGPFTSSQISLDSLEITRTAGGKIWPVPYSPAFGRETYSYTANMPAGASSITIKSTTQGGYIYNSRCNILVNGIEMNYSGTVGITGLVSGLNTIEIIIRRSNVLNTAVVATRVYTVYLTVSSQTFDCTACAVTGYDYPACTSADAPDCSGNYAMRQQTFREYDYMMDMGYVDGQVNICEDFTDFLEGEMYSTGGVIPATGKIVDSGSLAVGDFFTVEWYDYDECYQKAYESLNSLMSLIVGILPSYFNVSNVMNFDFYGYSRMQVVGVLNATDFPGIPTDNSATANVDENVVGQFCIIHLMDMPTRAAAEAVPFFDTNAEIAAVVSYYARYNPEDPATTGTPPAGYENIRKIYFLAPGAK